MTPCRLRQDSEQTLKKLGVMGDSSWLGSIPSTPFCQPRAFEDIARKRADSLVFVARR